MARTCAAGKRDRLWVHRVALLLLCHRLLTLVQFKPYHDAAQAGAQPVQLESDRPRLAHHHRIVSPGMPLPYHRTIDPSSTINREQTIAL
eukprot:4399201-Pleurochrysis_carterae.AAC.1